MFCLTVLYGHPTDIAEFDQHYKNIHIPLVTKIPGLRGYTVERPVSGMPDQTSPYHLIARLYFDTMEAFQSGMGSAEGQAAGADVQNFATGGAVGLIAEQDIVLPVHLA